MTLSWLCCKLLTYLTPSVCLPPPFLWLHLCVTTRICVTAPMRLCPSGYGRRPPFLFNVISFVVSSYTGGGSQHQPHCPANNKNILAMRSWILKKDGIGTPRKCTTTEGMAAKWHRTVRHEKEEKKGPTTLLANNDAQSGVVQEENKRWPCTISVFPPPFFFWVSFVFFGCLFLAVTARQSCLDRLSNLDDHYERCS